MNAPVKFPTTAKPASLAERVTDAIWRLREAAERDVPSATRARRIADDLEEAMNREQPILAGPFPEYSTAAYLLRDYRYAIDNICAEEGGWRAPLSSFADISGNGPHPLQGEAL